MPEKIADQIIYPPLIISGPEWGISNSKKATLFFFFFFLSVISNDWPITIWLNFSWLFVKKKIAEGHLRALQNQLHIHFWSRVTVFFMSFWHVQPFRLLRLERKHISGVTLILLVWDYGLPIADFGCSCLGRLNDFSVSSNNGLQWHSLSRRRDTKKTMLVKAKRHPRSRKLNIINENRRND